MNGILIGEDGDLVVSGGTLAAGNTDAQVCEGVLEAFPGEYKEKPVLGAACRRIVNGQPEMYWMASVKQMLFACGISVYNIAVTSDSIDIELNE